VTEFGKLVRDKIPDLISAEGQTPIVKVLPVAELRPALLANLAEEAAEAAAASELELPEELADVLEVVRALAGVLGLSMQEIGQLADEKRQRRGGFDQGLFLVRTEPSRTRG
jgi:predicted house-cleaning noncanonical NTP pyrophosphatase (MazG superfamily)